MTTPIHPKGTHPKLKGLATALFALLWTSASFAQTRFVIVNGIRMSSQQLAQLDYYSCTHIPNGSYWLNLVNGAWGYAGNWNVQGYFGDQCNRRGNGYARQQRQSLSQRGLLYSPGEILNGR